jgi:hypothetical protein
MYKFDEVKSLKNIIIKNELALQLLLKLIL